MYDVDEMKLSSSSLLYFLTLSHLPRSHLSLFTILNNQIIIGVLNWIIDWGISGWIILDEKTSSFFERFGFG